MRSARPAIFLTVSALAVFAGAFSVSADTSADTAVTYNNAAVYDVQADNTDGNKTETQKNAADLNAAVAVVNAAAQASPDTNAENVPEGAAAGIVLALASVVGTIVYVSRRQ